MIRSSVWLENKSVARMESSDGVTWIGIDTQPDGLGFRGDLTIFIPKGISKDKVQAIADAINDALSPAEVTQLEAAE